MRVHIGLGSNLGNRKEKLLRAVSALKSNGVDVLSVSSFYESDPVGPAQPEYLNAVCLADTSLQPRDLLSLFKRIETALGRVPSERWGPRVIDIDLLMYGDVTVNEEDLVLPHSQMINRDFVLIPLLEIDPGARLPTGEPVSSFSKPSKAVRPHEG